MVVPAMVSQGVNQNQSIDSNPRLRNSHNTASFGVSGEAPESEALSRASKSDDQVHAASIGDTQQTIEVEEANNIDQNRDQIFTRRRQNTTQGLLENGDTSRRRTLMETYNERNDIFANPSIQDPTQTRNRRA